MWDKQKCNMMKSKAARRVGTDFKRKETQKEKSAFVLRYERADKEPRTPDHQALDQ